MGSLSWGGAEEICGSSIFGTFHSELLGVTRGIGVPYRLVHYTASSMLKKNEAAVCRAFRPLDSGLLTSRYVKHSCRPSCFYDLDFECNKANGEFAKVDLVSPNQLPARPGFDTSHRAMRCPLLDLFDRGVTHALFVSSVRIGTVGGG